MDSPLIQEELVTQRLRVALEVGPKMKRIVAVAPVWPGLESVANSEEAAIEMLVSYIPPFTSVAKLARLGSKFAGVEGIDVSERYKGTG
jgi:hypothetical protein